MRQHGYSLIELLTVLGIAGILFLSAAPTVIAFRDSWRLHNEAAELATALEQMRFYAVLHNTNVRVIAAGREYSVGQPGSDARPFPLSSGVQFQGGRKSILFSSRGTASPGTTLTLFYKSRQVSVIIAPAGRIRIEP